MILEKGYLLSSRHHNVNKPSPDLVLEAYKKSGSLKMGSCITTRHLPIPTPFLSFNSPHFLPSPLPHSTTVCQLFVTFDMIKVAESKWQTPTDLVSPPTPTQAICQCGSTFSSYSPACYGFCRFPFHTMRLLHPPFTGPAISAVPSLISIIFSTPF